LRLGTKNGLDLTRLDVANVDTLVFMEQNGSVLLHDLCLGVGILRRSLGVFFGKSSRDLFLIENGGTPTWVIPSTIPDWSPRMDLTSLEFDIANVDTLVFIEWNSPILFLEGNSLIFSSVSALSEFGLVCNQVST
jgi:hypothetical protein